MATSGKASGSTYEVVGHAASGVQVVVTNVTMTFSGTPQATALASSVEMVAPAYRGGAYVEQVDVVGYATASVITNVSVAETVGANIGALAGLAMAQAAELVVPAYRAFALGNAVEMLATTQSPSRVAATMLEVISAVRAAVQLQMWVST